MKINILPASVYNRIAAGEVVDRPYSVVKELIENAIDAGAKNIDVAIEKGGKESIRVTDDGSGIERDDLQSAFLPHATSKIKNAEDLDTILTLGFRGEALASIASVAEVTILSKTEDGNAYRIQNIGGTLGEIIEAGGGKGTQVQVNHLFFNTPARQKFLKSDKGEEADVTNLISRLVLGHPEIAFTYYADGKKVCQSFGGGLEEAMAAVYDARTIKECISVKAEKHGIRIGGYIGNQNYFKANRSYQSVFINGRYVVNNTIQMAIANAYSSYMMKRQYPFYVLFIDVPPEIVDVNVHPNKADVRFVNNQVIYGTVYSVISSILDGSAAALDYVAEPTVKSTYRQTTLDAVPSAEAKKPEAALKVEPAYRSTFTVEEARKELELAKPKVSVSLPFEEVREKNVLSVHSPRAGFAPQVEKRRETEIDQNAFEAMGIGEKKSSEAGKSEYETADRNDSFAEKKEATDFFAENKKFLEELEAKKAKQAKIEVEECIYRGTLFQTYLIYERGDDAFLIDQHAAHERLIYNRLKEEMANRSVATQPMLLPYLLQTNVYESEFLLANLDHIRALGFDIDEFGTGTFKVSGVPVDLQSIRLDDFFQEILSDISGFKGIRLTDLLQDKLAMTACKAAVKGGMNLSEREVKELFRMMDGDMGLKCPHGRPVVVRLAKTEIEKMFKRIV